MKENKNESLNCFLLSAGDVNNKLGQRGKNYKKFTRLLLAKAEYFAETSDFQIIFVNSTIWKIFKEININNKCVPLTRTSVNCNELLILYYVSDLKNNHIHL